jgi:hypothetical protein
VASFSLIGNAGGTIMKRWLAMVALAIAASLLAASLSAGSRPVVADSLRPIFASLATVSCGSTSPCQTFSNSKSGAGAVGVSSGGKGIIGQTKFNSTSSANGTAGVLGQDISATGTFDIGVEGKSTRGTGVLGVSNGSQSTTAGVAGLLGFPSGQAVFASGAVFGDSKNGSGVLATSANASAIVAASTNSFGVNGLTFNKSLTTKGSASGVIGTDASSDGGALNVGVSGVSTNGIGVVAKSTNSVGANIMGGTAFTHTILPALSIVANTLGDFIDACRSGTANPCRVNDAVFSVQNTGRVFSAADIFVAGSVGADGSLSAGTAPNTGPGNVNISGQYQVSGSCVAGCTPATTADPGRAVRRYVPTQTIPTVEDFGEAQLTNGQAYVVLDPAFANVINQHISYLVFITPEGPNHGLYVTQKTLRGFAVRENPGGQSTIAFSYRIVATPFGEGGQRLQVVTVPALHKRGLRPHTL